MERLSTEAGVRMKLTHDTYHWGAANAQNGTICREIVLDHGWNDRSVRSYHLTTSCVTRKLVILSISGIELFDLLHERVSQRCCFLVHGWEYLCGIESRNTTFFFKHPKCSGATSPLQC